MKKRSRIVFTVACLFLAVWLVGCGAGQDERKPEESAAVQEETTQKETVQAEGEAQVASAEEMAKPVELDTEGLSPVLGDSLKDGEYMVQVDSSSSMFQITDCRLTVKDGKMTAVMTMGGTGYLKVYPGTGEEAAKASEDACIPFVETETGEHTFEIPVKALDQELDCAAFSKKKEKWYDRVLVFRSDSLPAKAWDEGQSVTAETLQLEDGVYTAEVRLEGGSGRASVESPARLRIENHQAFAEIVWGSPNYDYMKLDGTKYELLDTEGNSNFEIPVAAFDRKIAVTADTIAMSEPHEIEYTLVFDSATIQKVQ